MKNQAENAQIATSTQLQTAKNFLTQYAGFIDYDYAQMTNQEVIDLSYITLLESQRQNLLGYYGR